MNPNRRRFLGSVAVVAGAGLAGCSTTEDGEQDSDGDGVPDEEDYAPRDEDVQDREDVRIVTDTEGTADPSGTDTEEPTDQSVPISDGSDSSSALRAEAEEKMAPQGGATSADYRLVVTESEFYREDYTEGVRGVVENISETTFDYVEIRIGFYDESGAKLSDGLDNVSGLEPGERWRFDAMFFGTESDDLASFRVTALSGSDY